MYSLLTVSDARIINAGLPKIPPIEVFSLKPAGATDASVNNSISFRQYLPVTCDYSEAGYTHGSREGSKSSSSSFEFEFELARTFYR